MICECPNCKPFQKQEKKCQGDHGDIPPDFKCTCLESCEKCYPKLTPSPKNTWAPYEEKGCACLTRPACEHNRPKDAVEEKIKGIVRVFHYACLEMPYCDLAEQLRDLVRISRETK